MIDYELERNKYRPERVKTLLIGEAPPPSGKVFFYVPKKMSLGRSIEDDTSLPATIFNHYFGRRPKDITEYKKFLNELKNMGVFLIDIIDEPIKIRGIKQNENYLISKLPELKIKINELNEEIPEKEWIFLLARSSYKRKLREHYPFAKKIRWKDFRLKNKTAYNKT